MADYSDLVARANAVMGMDPNMPALDPFAAAAMRTRRSVRPPGGRPTNIDEMLGDVLIPKTPLDVAATFALGPGGRAGAKIAGLTLGAILSGDEAQAGPTAAVSKLFNKAGAAVKGTPYTKRAGEVLDEIAAVPKGAGPIDLSTAGQVPNVPQTPIERYVPPRGVSPRLQRALERPDVIRGIEQSVEAGRGLGADKWYHTEPVRRVFLDEFGPVEGPKRMALFMDMIAATSPRSDVPTNVRNASFYYQQALADKGLPGTLPYPYGHVAQNLHRQNYGTLTAPRPAGLSAEAPGTSTMWDVLQNPKPASFSQNLQGNLYPGTMDTHAFRNIAMRTGDPEFLATSLSSVYKPGAKPDLDTMVARFGEVKGRGDKSIVTFRPQQLLKEGRLSMDEAANIPTFWASQPNANEYAAAEEMYRRIGQRQGLPTADTQAAAWAGAGPLTGLGTSPSHTFPELLNERILFTAKMRGEKPDETLRKMITGRQPLLAAPGFAATSELDVEP
jgi:hypothetical protein